jgi:pimeloyl-ACP methyl ester carboxylesterase
MDRQPRLIDVATPTDPAGVVLVLHGGANRRGSPMVSPTQLSVLRMVPIARRIARAGHGRLAVLRLLNSSRGWDTRHIPVDDVAWALDELERHVDTLPPIALVGHSLGGRAALLAAADERVAAAVALAPYVYPSDGAARVDGRDILIVHGDRDRVADPQRSAAVARALSDRANVEFVVVPRGKHAMLRHHGAFSGPAARFVAEGLR